MPHLSWQASSTSNFRPQIIASYRIKKELSRTQEVHETSTDENDYLMIIIASVLSTRLLGTAPILVKHRRSRNNYISVCLIVPQQIYLFRNMVFIAVLRHETFELILRKVIGESVNFERPDRVAP